ncbi:MAG: hypothetical protein Alpg2KO_07040 [Alphaproteobacteria bacterium]
MTGQTGTLNPIYVWLAGAVLVGAGGWMWWQDQADEVRHCQGPITNVERLQTKHGTRPRLQIDCADGVVMTGALYMNESDAHVARTWAAVDRAVSDQSTVQAWQDRHQAALLGLKIGDWVIKDADQAKARKKPFGIVVALVGVLVLVAAGWNMLQTGRSH